MTRIALTDTRNADPRVRPVFEEYEERTGSVPSLIRALARDPDTLEVFLPLLRRVYGVSRISQDLKALVALHVSRVNECAYCGRDYVPTLVQLGYAPDDIEALGEALPTEEMFTERERSVLRFADEVTRYGAADRRTYERVAAHLDEPALVELTVLVGVCNLITRFVRTFEVEANR
jgi:alkylhydroperoxidase family enzyme